VSQPIDAFTVNDVAYFNKKAAADPAERFRWVEWANSYLNFQGRDRGEAAKYANKKIALERKRQGRRNPLDSDLRELLRLAAAGDLSSARKFRNEVRRAVGQLDLDSARRLLADGQRVRQALAEARSDCVGPIARANIDLIYRIEELERLRPNPFAEDARALIPLIREGDTSALRRFTFLAQRAPFPEQTLREAWQATRDYMRDRLGFHGGVPYGPPDLWGEACYPLQVLMTEQSRREHWTRPWYEPHERVPRVVENPDDAIRALERQLQEGGGAPEAIAVRLYREHRRAGMESNAAMQAASDAVIAIVPAGEIRGAVIHAIFDAYDEDLVREAFFDVMGVTVDEMRQAPDEWVVARVWSDFTTEPERQTAAARTDHFLREDRMARRLDRIMLEIERRAGVPQPSRDGWLPVSSTDEILQGAAFWDFAQSRPLEVNPVEEPGRAWTIDTSGYTLVTSDRISDGMAASGSSSERMADMAARRREARFYAAFVRNARELRSAWALHAALRGVGYALSSHELSVRPREILGVVIEAGTPRAEPASVAALTEGVPWHVVTDNPSGAIWDFLADLGVVRPTR
jgi:hypothetical protein